MPIYKMNGKKDGKQQYRVRINYTDPNGKAKQIDRVAYGSAEAKALESKLRAEIKEQAPASSMTLQELYEEYIQKKQYDVRESTLDKTKRVLNTYILPELGKMKIDKLNARVLQNWKNGMSERNLAVITNKGIYSEFRTLLNYAVKMEYLPKNPLANIENFKDAYFEMKQDKLQYYTAEQFKKYIAVAKEKSSTLTEWGYYVFFNIAFYTGMRKGEINALKWSDIDGDVIHVRRSIAQKLKGGDRETPPKNKSSYRDLQIPAAIAQNTGRT